MSETFSLWNLAYETKTQALTFFATAVNVPRINEGTLEMVKAMLKDLGLGNAAVRDFSVGPHCGCSWLTSDDEGHLSWKDVWLDTVSLRVRLAKAVRLPEAKATPVGTYAYDETSTSHRFAPQSFVLACASQEASLRAPAHKALRAAAPRRATFEATKGPLLLTLPTAPATLKKDLAAMAELKAVAERAGLATHWRDAELNYQGGGTPFVRMAPKLAGRLRKTRAFEVAQAYGRVLSGDSDGDPLRLWVLEVDYPAFRAVGDALIVAGSKHTQTVALLRSARGEYAGAMAAAANLLEEPTRALRSGSILVAPPVGSCWLIPKYLLVPPKTVGLPAAPNAVFAIGARWGEALLDDRKLKAAVLARARPTYATEGLTFIAAEADVTSSVVKVIAAYEPASALGQRARAAIVGLCQDEPSLPVDLDAALKDALKTAKGPAKEWVTSARQLALSQFEPRG